MKLQSFLASALIFLVSCGERERIAGNGGDIGNGIVAGRIVQPDGKAAIGASVECAPTHLAPWDARLPGWITLTDSTGSWRCTDLPEGTIGVSSFDPSTGLTRWHLDTSGAMPSILHVDTLAPSGTLVIALPPATEGTLYLTGLRLRLVVRGEYEVTIPGVAAGWSGTLYLALSTSQSVELASNVLVPPGSIDSVGFNSGTVALRVPLAGSLTSPLRSFPILVRLDSSWHGFQNTLSNGSDLRLRTAAGTPLPLTIASWDKSNRKGAFWTYFDSIPVPGDSVDLLLDYGLPVTRPNQGDAFSSAGGWEAVWPLGDTGSVVKERLGRYPGAPTSLGSVAGIAGQGSSFNGKTSKVIISGTRGGKLALPNGGPFTMSCWAKLNYFTSSRFVMGYGNPNTALKYQGNGSSTPNSWLVQDFRDAPAGAYFTHGPADTAVWTHLATTVDGDSIRLFIDGIRQTAALAFDGSDFPRSSVDFAIGTALDSLGNAYYVFPGDLSEVWVHNVVRSPDWIRFAASNQNPANTVARITR